jgi:Ca2+-binding RTX toxin-like protein
VSAFDNIVTLTSATNSINAQSGDDILTGDFSTIQQGDSLNGGSLGIDTLTISGGVAANAVTITAASATNQLAITNPVLTAANVPVVTGFERFDFSGFLGKVTYTGTTGYDWVQTGAGADILNGGVGADTLIGSGGNDTYVVDNLGDFVVENAGGGTDTIQSSLTYSLVGLANVENLTLTGATAINGTGNSGINVLTGNTGNNILNGGAGNDTLIGGTGNDTLIGGTGNDILTGGAGKDTLTGGTGTDRFVFTSLADSLLTANGGYDVISDYAIGEQIDAPPTVAAAVLSASIGNVIGTLNAANIAAAALPLVANTAQAFTVSSVPGSTFLVFNDASAVFNAATDSIVQLSNYSISATNTVTIV